MKSPTETIIKALRILARDIQSGDGVANAAIAEAADRLEEVTAELKRYRDAVDAQPWATDEPIGVLLGRITRRLYNEPKPAPAQAPGKEGA